MAQTIREEQAQYQRKLREGETVWCDFAEREARTADRFCEFCGSTEHQTQDDGSDPPPRWRPTYHGLPME